MTVKSYLQNKDYNFTKCTRAPIHLADYEGRHYYIFAENVTPPAGGKAVSKKELEEILQISPLFRQIKDEAKARIIAMVPLWQQINILFDILMLKRRQNLTDDEKDKLAKAQNLLRKIQKLRKRSDEIEASFLKGIEVDYLTDQAWEL